MNRRRRHPAHRSLWKRSRNYRRLVYLCGFAAMAVLLAFNYAQKRAASRPPPSAMSNPPPSPPAAYQPPPSSPAPVQAAAVPARPPVLDSSKHSDDSLASFPRVRIAWGDVLNPNQKMPTQGFGAYYLTTGDPRHIHHPRYPMGDSTFKAGERRPSTEVFTAYWKENPDRLIATEKVSEIGVHYNGNEFHGIPAPEFAAYWVGMIHVPQRTDYTFYVEQDWANTRILINRHRIYESGSKKAATVRLEPGDYILEVEYLNSWSTAHFNLSIDSEPETP